MPVVKIRIVSLKITLAFVHVNRVPLVIHCWVVSHYNTVRPIINVHRERFVKPVFVQPPVHRIGNVSPISFACKEFVNRLVTIIHLVPTSNSVKITSAIKRFDAVPMTNVCITNTVLSMHTVDRNVKMLAKVVYFVAEMLNVPREITMDCVHASKVSSMMDKVDADALNVKEIMIVLRINSARRISVNWRVKVERRAAKKQFAPLKIIDPFVIVRPAIAEIHMNNVTQSIIVVINPADREHYARITKEHSIVPVATDMWAMHTTKVVA